MARDFQESDGDIVVGETGAYRCETFDDNNKCLTENIENCDDVGPYTQGDRYQFKANKGKVKQRMLERTKGWEGVIEE